MSARPRWRTALSLIIGLVVVLYLVVFVGLRAYVTPGFLRAQMERAVLHASDGAYTVDFDEVTVGWNLSIRIRYGRLVPAPGSDRRGRNQYEASFGRFTLEGLNLWSLVRHRRLHLRSIRLQRPGLIIRFAGPGDLPSVLARIETRLRAGGTPTEPVGLVFDEIILLDGRMRLERDVDGARQTTFIEDFDLEVRDLNIGPGQDPVEQATISLSIALFRRSWSDQRQEVRIEDITMASLDSTLRVDRFTMEPPTDDEVYLAGLAARKDLIRAFAWNVEATGFDLTALVKVPQYRARTLRADSLVVDVLSDRRIPAADDVAPNMPTRQLAALETPVAVDSLSVRGGTISYREIPASGEPAGVVTFDAVSGLITGIGSMRDPVEATMSTMLFGSVPTTVTLWLPLGSTTFNLRYVARAGPAGVAGVNTALVPLEGIELQEGFVDSVMVEATVVDGHASGTFQAHWRDLTVRLVDRETGRSNLVKQLGSLAANTLVVPTDNPRNGSSDPRIGEIRYIATDRDSFFGFLWRTARSGILSLLNTR